LYLLQLNIIRRYSYYKLVFVKLQFCKEQLSGDLVMVSQSDYLEMCPLFQGIPSEVIKQHTPSTRVESFSHGSVIYKQGQRLSEIFCVLEGQVKLARISIDGTEFTMGLLAKGGLFGASLNNSTTLETQDSAIVKGDGSVLCISVNEFRDLLLNYPPLGMRVVELLDLGRQKMERRLECFAFKRVELRLIETLKELSGGFEQQCEHGFGQHIRLSQQELADMVGATRPVVSTILNRLRKEDVLGYSRDYVCIRGFDEIEKILRSAPPEKTVI
jgi:CRP/FNR family cyclic AMP-dependent transcriptional regulator